MDRGRHEDMGDEEIMMLPLGRQEWGRKYLLPEVHERAMRDDEEYRRQYHEPEWEDAVSLANVVRIGLDYPRRSFTVYLRPKESGLEHVILSFTADDLLLLGVAVDVETEEGHARAILRKIMLEYDCELAEPLKEAPPCSEAEFRKLGVASTICILREVSGGSGCFRRGRRGCLFARGAGRTSWLRAAR